jgi:protein-glutamine gamma-glutamyltransferase
VSAIRPSPAATAVLAVGATIPALTTVVLTPLLLRLAVVWVLVSSGSVLIASARRRTWSAVAHLLLVFVAVTVVVTSLPTGRAASWFEALAIGLVDGPRLLLETTIPVAGTAEQSVPLVLLLGLGTVLAVLLSQLPRPAVALFPSLAVLLVFSVLAAGTGIGVLTAAALWCLAAGLVLTVTHADGPAPDKGKRGITWSVAVLGTGVLLATGAGAAVAATAPQAYDPHHTDVPVTPDDPRTNPLDLVSAWRATGRDTPLFEISGFSGRLTWATLESYDGVSWSTEHALAPTGPMIETPVLAWPVIERCAEITPDAGFTGPLLPVPAPVSRVEGPLIMASGVGGMVAAARPGPIPRYRACGEHFSSETSQAISARLATATSSGLGPGVGTALPSGGAGTPGRITSDSVVGLHDYLDKVAADGPPLPRLQRIAEFLRGSDRYGVTVSGRDPKSGGTATTEYSSTLVSTQRLLAAGLTGKRPRARAELYPQAFAVLARALGVPSRVVVGFDARTSPVGTAQSLVWPEVWVDGAGWLAFDVTPSRSGGEAESFESESTPTSLGQNQEPAAPPSAPEKSPVIPLSEEGGFPWRVSLMSAALVLLVGWPGALAVFRLLRRRRLVRGADARGKIVGVWRGLLLDLGDVGVPVENARTPTSWALQRPREAEPLRELGQLADRALYSAEPLADGESDRATVLATSVRRSVVRGLSGRDRLLRAITPPTRSHR